MTNKTQTMFTIALTAAVSLLLVDRIIEPAQAQDCASPYDVVAEADRVIKRVLFCIDGGYITDGSLSTYCNS